MVGRGVSGEPAARAKPPAHTPARQRRPPPRALSAITISWPSRRVHACPENARPTVKSNRHASSLCQRYGRIAPSCVYPLVRVPRARAEG